MVELMDCAPSSITPKEMCAALVFAENANDSTRMIWASIEDPKFLHRIRVKRARLYELVDGLVSKGVLELASAGHRHGRAKYRFLPMAPAQCPEGSDTEHSDADLDADEVGSPRAFRTLDDDQCPEDPDTEASPELGGPDFSIQRTRTLNHDQCPEHPDVSVWNARTPTPLSPSLLPPRPRLVPNQRGGLELGEEAEEEADSESSQAAALLAALPFDESTLDVGRRHQLLEAITAGLAVGWTDEALKKELFRELDGARSPIGIWLHRLKPDRLGPPRVATAGPKADVRPPWCGVCDERTRLVEVDDVTIDYCRTCHPTGRIRADRPHRARRQ